MLLPWTDHFSLQWNTTEKSLVETALHWNGTGETLTIAADTGTPLITSILLELLSSSSYC